MSRWALLLALLAGCDDGGSAEPADAAAQTQSATDAELSAGAEACATPVDGALVRCPDGPQPFLTPGELSDPDQAAAAQPYATHAAQDTLEAVAASSLGGQMARGKGMISKGFVNEVVSAWIWSASGSWFRIGGTNTDDEGQFTLDISALELGVGSHRIYSVLDGDGSCALHGAFIWPVGTQIVLTDIDGTLTSSDAELVRQLSDPAYDPTLKGGAVALMQAWVAKGYQPVYLTSRPHQLRLQTRAWLDAHQFPFGPLITADSLVFGDTARDYKAGVVSRLTGDLGWRLVKAYGNATSDIAGYAQAGVPKDDTYIIGENGGIEGTVAIIDDDYASHIQAVVEPFEAAGALEVGPAFCAEN